MLIIIPEVIHGHFGGKNNIKVKQNNKEIDKNEIYFWRLSLSPIQLVESIKT